MTATLAPFGLRPSYHPTGLERANLYPLSAAYATPIYKGSPVVLTSNFINLAAAAADWLGVFAGVTYTDATGKPVITNYWPGAVSGATNIQAWVWDDPYEIYDMQCGGSIALSAVGRHGNFDGTIGNGSVLTGLSAAAMSSTLAAAGVQGSLRIMGVNQAVDNAWGDAFTVLQVQNARHQFVANKVSV